MSYKIYSTVLGASIVLMGALLLFDVERVWVLLTLVVAAVAFVLLMWSMMTPLNAVENGMYLLREQDYSTRLRWTGQRDADKVVELFNGLIDTMKAERLKTLEQENFLEHLIKASPMGIAICNFNREIISSNRAFERMAGPAVRKLLWELREGESRVVRPTASQVLRCSRLWFMDSGFKRTYYLVELLTDEVMNAETNVFNKIVRTMGHEVNNTLGSVVSVLETVEMLNAGDEGLCAAVGSSRERCLSLVSFVKSYADIVKLPEPTLQRLSLGEWIEGLKPFLAGMAGRNITMAFERSDDSVDDGDEVMVDPMLLERVVVNIVKNAVESIGVSKGRITVSIARHRLTVTDNGPGISAENAARLFTPFFSTKKADRGLGLMLVSEVLRRHKAAFSLHTDETDGLTRFVIEFRPTAGQVVSKP